MGVKHQRLQRLLVQLQTKFQILVVPTLRVKPSLETFDTVVQVESRCCQALLPVSILVD